MFAKVFEQIFDSSIAEDYTVRHMFIDLLILADPTGAVDMTPEAISRRTNVPEDTVKRCIAELCQPDVKSRSPLEDGKRLVPLDSHRDWGWRIVNYHHYRQIRDQEARRSYFRDYQRKRRRKERSVKDKKVNSVNGVEISSSTSSSESLSKKKPKDRSEVRQYFANDLKSNSETADDFYDHFENNGWRIGGRTPMKDWHLAANRWKRNTYATNQRRSTGSNRNIGTANEGKSSQYAGVGKILGRSNVGRSSA